MIREAAIPRSPAIDARTAAAMAAVPVLIAVGYAAFSDLRMAAVLLGVVALGGWAVFAYQRPLTAMPLAFPLLLLAGTKFRVRDAAASLDGAVDAQVAMELGLFGFVAVGLAAAWLRAGDRRRLSTGELAIGAYVAVAALSVLWSASPMLTVVRAGQLAIVAGCVAGAVRVLSPARALWTAIAFLTLHVLLFAAAALVVPGWYGTVDVERPGRFAWFAVHPIEVATLAGMAGLGLLGAVLFAPLGRRARLFGLPAVMVALPVVAVMFFASSRGAMLAFVGAVGLLVLLKLHGSIRWPAIFVGSALALGLVIAAPRLEWWLQSAATQSAFVDRAFFRGQGVETVLEMNGRVELWQDLLPVVGNQVFTGFGYQASRGVLLATAEWAAYAHNAVMQTLLDLGIFGTLALLAVIACSLSAFRRTGLAPWLKAAVSALAVFLAVNSIAAESFAAAPGYDALVLFLCAVCATWRNDPASVRLS